MNTNQHSIVFSRDLTPRIVAIVVVLMLALSAIPMVSNPVGADGSGTYPAPAAGDWVISNETSVWNETIILKGNLTIENGGKLILNNVTLLFDSSSDGEFGITVKDGGELQVLGKKEVTKGARLRGDYDLFSGTNGGQVSFYKNAGTLAEPDWQEPVSLRDGGGDTIDVGDRSAPFFGDLDNDGDMDLIVGERRDSGQVNYYENTGTTEFPEWTRDDSMFSGVTAGGHSKPTLADTDNDGDLDLTTGSDSEGGEVYYFENTGTPQEASWGSREDLQDKDGQHINMDSRCWPTYADLDNDGDMDLTIGRSSGDDGQIFYYKNTGTRNSPEWTKDDSMYPKDDVTAGQWNYAPAFADLDNDGDLDLTIGSYDDGMFYYENTGTKNAPVWTEDTTMYENLGSPSRMQPAFADIDSDGPGYVPGGSIWHTNITTTGAFSFNFVVEDGAVLELRDTRVMNSGDGITGNQGLTVQTDDAFIHGSLFEGNHWGVYLDGVSGALVENNSFVNNTQGVHVKDSSDCTIANSTILSNSAIPMALGMDILDSTDITIQNSNITGGGNGIVLQDTRDITLRDSNFTGCGLSIRGDLATEFDSHTIVNNSIFGKPLYYYANTDNITVPADAGAVILANSSGAIIKGLDISSTDVGTLLAFSDDTVIVDTSISDSDIGLHLYASDRTTVTRSTFEGNVKAVVLKADSADNVLNFNAITGSAPWGVDASGNGGDVVDATKNFWGHISGPFHATTNVNGKGGSVSDDVLFDPWLRALPGENLWYVNASAAAGGNGSQAKPFQTIQEAVDMASKGETIMVFAGTYTENVQVDKELNIVAEDQVNTIVDASGGTGFELLGEKTVELAGLTIKNANIGVKVMGKEKTFCNLSIETTTTPFYLGAEVMTSTRDSTFNNSALGFGDENATLYERNNFHILIRDPYFIPVPQVQVQITNKDGEIIRNTETLGDGTIGYVLLPYETHKQGNTTDFGPYTVDLQKGKKDSQRIFAMDTNVNHIELWFESTKFGEAVGIGDFNGDGVDDYAVGAPFDDGNGIDSGAVYIYLGGDHLVLEDLTPVNYDFVIYGSGSNTEFGTSLALDNDLSGDGYNDLVVGAPFDNLTEVTGIRARYYHSQGENKFANLVLDQMEETINYNWGGSPQPGVNADEFAVKWTGFINIEQSADYTFYTEVDDGVRFYLNEEMLIESWQSQGATEYDSAPIHLEPGLHEFLLEYYEGGGDGAIKLRWSADHISKGIIPAEVFHTGSDKDPGNGVVYLINGGKGFLPIDEDGLTKERPLNQELKLNDVSSMVLEPEPGVHDFGKMLRYLGDINGDGYPELGVLGTRDSGMDRLAIYHGTPLTQGHKFMPLISQLPETDGEKDFSAIFFTGEWDTPITGGGGLLTASPEGLLSLDTSAGSEAYAYVISKQGAKLGLDVTLEFRVTENTNPVLSIMDYKVAVEDVGNSTKQAEATLLKVYERGRADIFQYPGAPYLRVDADNPGDFMTVRVVVTPEHDYLSLYFDGRLADKMNISGWDDELYLLVGDSSSETIDATVEVSWLNFGLFAEYLNTDSNVLSFSGGDFTGDGVSELVLSSYNTLILSNQEGKILPIMDNATKLFGNGEHNGTAYGGNILTIAGAILNGDFDDGWESWTQTDSIRGENDGTWEITTEEHGDWKVYDGPTAGLGPDGNVGDGEDCDGKLMSDSFVIGQGTEYIEFWHHAKWNSYEYANENGWQDDTDDFIAIRLVELGSEDIVAQLVYKKDSETGENGSGEEEGILQFDVSTHGGKEVRLEMEVSVNRPQNDDGLIQIDAVKAYPTLSGGTFISQNITLEQPTAILIPQWNEETNNGNVSFKLRKDNSTEWEDVPEVENSQQLRFKEPITQFQYRFDLVPGQDSPSPRVKNLQFIHYSEGSQPLQLNTTDEYRTLAGQITDDDNWELLLHSGNLEVVLVLDGTDLKDALDNNEAYFELDNYLMKLEPGVAEDSASFGSEVSLISDIDGDNLVDILVSDPQGEDSKTAEGIVYAFYSSDVKVEKELKDAAFQFAGGDDNGALGAELKQNLAGFPYAVRPRVEVLPSYLIDVSAATFNLDNTSMVYPATTKELSLLVANIGFQGLGDVDYQMDIAALKGGYTHSFDGTIPGILFDKSEFVNLSWDVPADENNSYYINISLATAGDQDTSNNWRSVLVESRFYRTTLETDRTMVSKRPNEFLSYNVTIYNIGTMGDDQVTLGAEVPTNWEFVYRYQGNNVTTLNIEDNETVQFLVRSPLDAGLVVDWAYNFTLNISSQSGVTAQYLELEGYLVEVDLIPVNINFYRRDGLKIVDDSKHLVEDDLSTVEIVVQNQGNLSSKGFDVQLYRNDSYLITTLTAPAVAAGKTTKLRYEGKLPAGDVKFTAVVDPDNQCFEYIETNNEYSTTTTIIDNTAKGPYRIQGSIYDLDENPVEGANFIVTVEGYGLEFSEKTNEEGKAFIELSEEDYRDGSKLKVEGLKGNSYAYTSYYAYSEDGESQDVYLALMKYNLDIQVDSLTKFMYMNSGKTAYIPVDYVITINNTEEVEESYRLTAERPIGWRYEFLGNVSDIGGGEYEVAIDPKSRGEVILRLTNRDEVDTVTGKDFHANQRVEASFLVESISTPFSFGRTVTTVLVPEDNLTVDGVEKDGLYEDKETGRYFKDLEPGTSSVYTINLINYGNTHKRFYLLNEGENSSAVVPSVTSFTINCLDLQYYRAEFELTLTVPEGLAEGSIFYADILLIDENSTFSEYVNLGVVVQKTNNIETKLLEVVPEEGNRTSLSIEFFNPTVNHQFVEPGLASFIDGLYTGNFFFSTNGVMIKAGESAVITLTVEQDNMGATEQEEDIGVRFFVDIDNSTQQTKQLAYPAQRYMELVLSSETTENLDLYPGETYQYFLELENKGNGESDIISFVIQDELGWGQTLQPRRMEQDEIELISFQLTVPQDTEGGVYNNITITPVSKNGKEHQALKLVNRVNVKSRFVSMNFNDHVMGDGFVNYTLRIRNEGNYVEDVRTEVLIPGEYSYTIIPAEFRLRKGEQRYINLVVTAPQDNFPFDNYTVQLYPSNGNKLLSELSLPGLPVSRISVTNTGSLYSFTSLSESKDATRIFWEVNNGMIKLNSSTQSAPVLTLNLSKAGVYRITLQTISTDGDFRDFIDISERVVTIENQLPDLTVMPEAFTVEVNQTLTIDGSKVVDVDGVVVEMMFVHNGTVTYATKLSINFTEPGEYVITVTAVDNLDGIISKDLTITVTAQEVAEESETDDHMFADGGMTVLWGFTFLLSIVLVVLFFFEQQADDEETEALCNLEAARAGELPSAVCTPKEEAGMTEKSRMSNFAPKIQMSVPVVVEKKPKQTTNVKAKPEVDAVIEVEEEAEVEVEAEVAVVEPDVVEPEVEKPTPAPEPKKKGSHHHRKKGHGKQLSFKERAELAKKKR